MEEKDFLESHEREKGKEEENQSTAEILRKKLEERIAEIEQGLKKIRRFSVTFPPNEAVRRIQDIIQELHPLKFERVEISEKEGREKDRKNQPAVKNSKEKLEERIAELEQGLNKIRYISINFPPKEARKQIQDIIRELYPYS